MTMPAMDKPSVAFAHLLDSMVVETRGGEDSDQLFLVHTECGEPVCEIEDTDSLRVLLNTALAHTC